MVWRNYVTVTLCIDSSLKQWWETEGLPPEFSCSINSQKHLQCIEFFNHRSTCCTHTNMHIQLQLCTSYSCDWNKLINHDILTTYYKTSVVKQSTIFSAAHCFHALHCKFFYSSTFTIKTNYNCISRTDECTIRHGSNEMKHCIIQTKYHIMKSSNAYFSWGQ